MIRKEEETRQQLEELATRASQRAEVALAGLQAHALLSRVLQAGRELAADAEVVAQVAEVAAAGAEAGAVAATAGTNGDVASHSTDMDLATTPQERRKHESLVLARIVTVLQVGDPTLLSPLTHIGDFRCARGGQIKPVGPMRPG